MKKRKKNMALLMALLLAITCLLAGCRPSPVLVQKIYTSTAKEIDRDLMQYRNDQEGEKNEDFHESESDEEANQDQEEYTAGKQDGDEDQDETTDGSAKKLQHNDKAENQGNATESSPNKPDKKEEPSQPEESTQEESSEEESSEEEESLDLIEESEDQEDPEDDMDDEEEEGGDEEESETHPKKDVTDGNGEVQEIPEDVQGVTAVGYAAPLVEMLGGSGRLIACDSDLAYNDLANTLFQDLSSGQVESWWEGDGSEPIDDYSFESLLESKPEVCFEISGQDTFTSDQIEEMKEAGIAYMPLPKLKDSDDLVDAAYIIAEVLEENQDTGKSSKSIARKYEDWIKSVKDDVSTNRKHYSVYIAEWRDDIGYTFQSRLNYAALPVDQGGMGSGVAIAWSPKKNQLVSEWMKAAGVTNESTAQSQFDKTSGVYVAPMFHQFSAKFDNEAYTYFSKNIATSYDWFLVHNYGGGVDPALLGSSEYPGIIVADQNIKFAIENSWYWQYHGVFDLGDIVVRAGYVNEATGDIFSSSIIGEYDIHVNPYGLGDWAEGCVDSPLEAYFVGNTIAGTVSDSSLKSAVKSFYQKFFNTSLDEYVIDSILEGRS